MQGVGLKHASSRRSPMGFPAANACWNWLQVVWRWDQQRCMLKLDSI